MKKRKMKGAKDNEKWIKNGTRDNINSTYDNYNSIINTCRSNIKSNTTEKEEYLKQPVMQK